MDYKRWKEKNARKSYFEEVFSVRFWGSKTRGGLEGKIDLRGFWEQGRPGMVSLELYP